MITSSFKFSDNLYPDNNFQNRTMKPKGGGRAVLGDITSRQNVAQPSEGKGKVAVPEGKQRVTRLAARKLAQVEQVLVAKVENR